MDPLRKSISPKDVDEQELPREATAEEVQSLVHEVGDIPLTAWLLTFTGAASNLAKFGITVMWQNYLQNPRGNPLLPGALDLGQSKATTIQNACLFFRYLTPTPFAILSDAWLGRHTTMHISLGLLILGYGILTLTSIPAALEKGAGLPGFLVSMFLTGLGHGGLSAVMYPFIADQIPDRKPMVKKNKKGLLVVTQRQLSIQYVFNGYYWMVNIASLSIIPTTLLERHIDFWLAFLLPTVILLIAIIPVVCWHRHLVKLPSEGNVLPQAWQVIVIACRSKFRLSEADPERQKLLHDRDVPWTSAFVNEISRGLKGCRVILFFVIFWLCYDQTNTNIVSQGAQMRAHGISNDTIQALNPLACIILAPIIQDILFPFLRRRKVPFGPISRMTVAFIFTAAGIAYAAGIQKLIYSTGPCFNQPLQCPEAVPDDHGPRMPNDVTIWLQTPYLCLLAVAEILGLVALTEYTYSEAPQNLKAMVQALQNMSAAAGAALGMALGPVSKDPWLVILFSSLTGAMVLFTVVFWVLFRKCDSTYTKHPSDAPDAIQDTGHDTE